MTNEIGFTRRTYSIIQTALLCVLFLGIFMETVFSKHDLHSKILPITYLLCCMYALLKRWTIFYCKRYIENVIIAIENVYEYPQETNIAKNFRFSSKNIALIHSLLISLMMMLFILAYASPFSNIFLGKPLNYSIIIYPIYIPWQVKTISDYIITYFIEAILVSPALIGIYTNIIVIVFSVIGFKYELDKICEFLRTVESRALTATSSHGFIRRNNKESEEFYYKNSITYKDVYSRNLRQCIQHYQIITR